MLCYVMNVRGRTFYVPDGLCRITHTKQGDHTLESIEDIDNPVLSWPTESFGSLSGLYIFETMAHIVSFNQELSIIPFRRRSCSLTPISHPFIVRLIGTIRREYLDQLLFWNANNLEHKLANFRQHYNSHRAYCTCWRYSIRNVW